MTDVNAIHDNKQQDAVYAILQTRPQDLEGAISCLPSKLRVNQVCSEERECQRGQLLILIDEGL